MIDAFFLLLGLGVWYVYYGLECAINGGTIGRNQWTMHFPLLLEEVRWILPGGWARKLSYVRGDVELAATLPGPFHFLLTHALLGPLVMYRWMTSH